MARFEHDDGEYLTLRDHYGDGFVPFYFRDLNKNLYLMTLAKITKRCTHVSFKDDNSSKIRNVVRITGEFFSDFRERGASDFMFSVSIPVSDFAKSILEWDGVSAIVAIDSAEEMQRHISDGCATPKQTKKNNTL